MLISGFELYAHTSWNHKDKNMDQSVFNRAMLSFVVLLGTTLLTGCGDERQSEEHNAAAVTQFATVVGQVDPELARDYVDKGGRAWRFVSAHSLSELRIPDNPDNAEKDPTALGGAEAPPSLEEYLNGHAARIRGKGGILYEYISVSNNRHLEARIAWHREAASRDKPSEIHNVDLEVAPPEELLEGQAMIGLESRSRHPTPHLTWPNMAVGQIFLSNHSKHASMFMIGQNTAISAAHAFWLDGSWFPVSYFAIGNYNGITNNVDNGGYRSLQVFGDWEATIHTTWQASQSSYYDIAVIEFDTDPGNVTGWLGVDATPPSPTAVRSWQALGYPKYIGLHDWHGFQAQEKRDGIYDGGVNPPNVGWNDTNYPDWRVFHTFDLTQGASGGPFFYMSSGYAYAVSVSVGGWSTECPTPGVFQCNMGPRLGSVWLPFVENNSSWVADIWGGSAPWIPSIP